MQYSIFLIPPGGLRDRIEYTSQRIVREVYDKDIQHIFYRIRSKPLSDNHRKLYIPGPGTVHELDVIPHSTLVHPFSTEDRSEEEQHLDGIIRDLAPPRFSLDMQGLGSYEDAPFMFFIKLTPDQRLLEFQKRLQNAIGERYLLGQRIVNYTPHITLLYDDVEPEKVQAARALIDESDFTDRFDVDYVSLCRQYGGMVIVDREVALKDPVRG